MAVIPTSPPELDIAKLNAKTNTAFLLPYEKQDLQISSTSLIPHYSKDTERKEFRTSSASLIIKPIAISEFKPGWRFYLAFFAIMVITLAAALDTTSLSVALPEIAQKLGGSAIEAFWSGTAFFLTSTVFQLNFASFSHIFGRKNMLMIAIGFFAAGAVIAATANGFASLLVGRAIQGVGAGGINALTDIIVTDLVPLRQRGKWLGLLNSMWALGSVGGPLVGGVFALEVSWRWIFWINLPLCVVGTALMALFLQLHFIGTSFGEQLKRVDWIGSLLFIVSTVSFLVPITLGGVILPRNSWALLVPLILGVSGLIGFVFYEIYIPVEPLVRFSIFRTRTASVTYFQTFLHALIVYSVLYYLPLYYEAVKGLNSVFTGIAMFPEAFTVVPAAIACGVLISVWGRYKWAMWSGWILTVLGSGLLQFLGAHTPTAVWISINIVLGLGTGLIFQPVNMAIQSSVDTADVAFAVAFASFLECFGEAIGIATCGAIFQNRLRAILVSSPMLTKAIALEYSKDATSLVRMINDLHPNSLKRNFLIQPYADSLRTVWLVMTILASVALLSTFLITDNTLDVELRTEQGFQHHEKVPDSELVSTNETTR